MIVYKLMKDLNEEEIFRCIRLINAKGVKQTGLIDMTVLYTI
jgi:hypothetical protein